ncbi:MAG: glutathione S-transferase C-terminal domain-containing protein [Solirubrobacterales bacterium]|nr:glutathione S-transferase C-terminal domain-containing protein [Solirubrobacterales bacterium]
MSRPAPFAYSLAPEEVGDDGAFHRQESRFRGWVTADRSGEFTAEAGRYHLYVSRACPWAHRTIIGRWLMGLEPTISISFVDPFRDERGWAFTGGRYEDPVNGFRFLAEAYEATSTGFNQRLVTVPVLWECKGGVIVNNESADILRMLSTTFAPLAEHPVQLCPAPLRTQIDALNSRIYDTLNDGVYKAGFAGRQDVYEREVRAVFAMLDELDARLKDRRFLFGPEPLETDWRVFTTLVRFDAVYHIHFKCSIRKITEYKCLWPYLRDLYQQPGIAQTVDFDEIRAHYYTTHPMVNPTGLVALRPAEDLGAPHGREVLG